MAEGYLPIILIVSLNLLHEQLTKVHKAVTEMAVVIGKIGLWLLLGPALAIFIHFVALGYQSAAKQVDMTLQKMLNKSLDDNDSDRANHILATRNNLGWRQSPLTFILTVVKSASVSIPLLITFTAYIMQHIASEEELAHLFMPKQIIDFIKVMYH